MLIKCEHCHALFRIPDHKFKDYIENTFFCEHCKKPAKFVFKATMRWDKAMIGELVDVGSEDD